MISFPSRKWTESNPSAISDNYTKNRQTNEKLRKLTYGNILAKQMEAQLNQSLTQSQFKQKEKELVLKQVQQETQKQISRKVNKYKTEQLYQIQNLGLLELNKNNRQASNNVPIYNQFNKLEEGERRRKIQTRQNFEQQNLLNNKQIQIKKSLKNKEKQINVHTKEMYDSYIEGEYKRQQSDREIWKNKYLFDSSIREVANSKNYDTAYQAYLKKQIQDRNQRKHHEKDFVDDRMRVGNRSIDVLTASPAYLGMTESFDRKKQISVMDKHLNFEPYRYDQKYAQLRPRPRPSHQNDQHQRSPASKMQIILPEFKRIGAPTTSQPPRYEPKPQNKIHKQFISYDFITGTQKTFFM